MKKAVTVQAKTVEEAIQQALELIGLPIEEVQIDVLSNPGRRLMGFRKVMAEVTVTQLVEEQQSAVDFMELERLVNEVVSGETPETQQPDFPEAVDGGEDFPSGARIRNGEIELKFGEKQYPVILPSENVSFFVNGVQMTERTTIIPTDEVTVTLCDELVQPQFSIQLIEQEMIALLQFTPGKRVTRTLQDTDFKPHFQLVASEEIEYFNNLQPQQIVDELKAMDILQGLLFPAIKKVTDVTKPYELIVAKGTLPVEGTDGDLEVHIQYEEFDPNGMGKVNFREMNAITNVKEGQIIATHIPPIPGVEGRSLLGKVIPVKPVRDIVLRLGKNVLQDNQHVVAKISGKPSLDWREKLVKVEVNHEFDHPGEVGLESGNIRFEGDVRIGGNVQPSMFVGATGSIQIGGSVSKATIHAVKSAVIRGNVLTSTISVGKQEVVISELVDQLQVVLTQLEDIKHAIDQILLIRGNDEEGMKPSELKRLIFLLVEKKYSHFEKLNKEFIKNVKGHSEQLAEEWIEMADRLYDAFVNPLNEDLEGLTGFGLLIEDAKVLVDLYGIEVSPQTHLILPYAINSVLYSNGDIEVTTKGVYHSSLTAENNVIVRGVCRGGEITAGHDIVLQETGSENLVKTVIKTKGTGSIKIGKAYAGTEIHVGTRKHIFSIDGTNITAKLDTDGELSLG